ncbi:Gamma-glutamyltranspeptidase 1 [Dirofilaria immitis]|nr:Gamma-glutamyltranspeptidase 1 [Dirofilaria immitis]
MTMVQLFDSTSDARNSANCGKSPTKTITNGTIQNNNSTVPEINRQHSLKWPGPSGSLHARYKRAAIATDNGICSGIGRDILMLGGNAIDATVASLICIGVVNPQSSGLGGGFLMTVYNSTSNRCIVINARETAPAVANETMFNEAPEDALTDSTEKYLYQLLGYRSIATPSELHGLWTIFSLFGSGKISWHRLFQPSIDLALEGFPISGALAEVLAKLEETILAEPSLKKVFVDPKTDKVYKEGDIITRDHLGATLQNIANSSDPIQLFYRGGIAQTIAAEIEEHGGYVSLNDLRNYETKIDEIPIIAENFLGNYAMCGPPPPSSASVTQNIILTIAEFYDGKIGYDKDDPLTYHRLIEAQKFGYAQRTKLADAAFVPEAKELAQKMIQSSYVKRIKSLINDKALPLNTYVSDLFQQPEDHGTSHVSAIDRDNNAVSCTSTINRVLGSFRVSPTLGIIWNNEMDDFSIPVRSNSFGFVPSPTNYIQPGKRPLSSMSPMVIYDKNTGKIKMVIGASGGPIIISAIAQTVIHALIYNETIKEAVDAPRFHNQFMPPTTLYEASIPQEIITNLADERNQNMTLREKLRSVVQALIVNSDGYIYGNSDFRRETGSFPAGF